MPRKLRVQYPGAMYHVMSRGDRREDIFLDDVDRQDFLKTLAEACQKTDWQIHAYCLMRNHYHLVLEERDHAYAQGHCGAGSTGHLEGSQYQSAQMDASQTTRKPGASPCPIMNEPFYGMTPI